MKNAFFLVTTLIISLFLLGFAVRGRSGIPIYFQTNRDTGIGSPFEGTNSSSRFALTESIVKSNSLFLNESLAAFSSPDISKINGKYLSIFTPGVSLIGVPFYYLGSIFNLQQLTTYLSITLLSLLNIFLVAKLASKLGAGFYSSILSGFLFLFATNAYPYAVTFTQHQVSVTLIILMLLNTLQKRGILSNIIFGFLLSAAAIVDIPNIILSIPILIVVIYKNIFIEKSEVFFQLKQSLKRISMLGIFIGLVPITGLFLWYNYQVTGNYFKLAQTQGRAIFPEDPQLSQSHKIENETVTRSKDFHQFESRRQLNGLGVLLFSRDRGLIYYSPVVLIGFISLFWIIRSKKDSSLASLMLTMIGINVLLYSMFNDPWGGWAFGPRYLIPSFALLCSGLGILLDRLKKNIFFLILLCLVALYGIFVNTLSAVTTVHIPPAIQAVHLLTPIHSDFRYNLELIQKNFSGSLIYNVYLFDKITSTVFLAIVTGVSSCFVIASLIVFSISKNRQ